MGCGACSKKASRRYSASSRATEEVTEVEARDRSGVSSPAVSSTASPYSRKAYGAEKTAPKAQSRARVGNKLGGPLVCLSVGPSHEALAVDLAEDLSQCLRASSRLFAAGASYEDCHVEVVPIGNGVKALPCEVLVPLLTPQWLRDRGGITLLRSTQRLGALGLAPPVLPLLHLASFGKRPDALALALGAPAGDLMRQVAAPGSWGRLDSAYTDSDPGGIEGAVAWLSSRVEALLAPAASHKKGAAREVLQRDELQSWRQQSRKLVEDTAAANGLSMPIWQSALSANMEAVAQQSPPGMPNLRGSPQGFDAPGRVRSKTPFDAEQELEGILAAAISEHAPRKLAGFRGTAVTPGFTAQLTPRGSLLYPGQGNSAVVQHASMHAGTTNAWANALRQECGKPQVALPIAEVAFGAAWADGVREQHGESEAAFGARGGRRLGNAMPLSLEEPVPPVPTRKSHSLQPQVQFPQKPAKNGTTIRDRWSRAAAWKPRDTWRRHDVFQDGEEETLQAVNAVPAASSSAPPTPRGREDNWDHFNLRGQVNAAATATEGMAVLRPCSAFAQSAPCSPRGTTTSFPANDPFRATMQETCWGSTATFWDKQKFAKSKMSDTGTGWGWPVQEEEDPNWEDEAWEGLDKVNDFQLEPADNFAEVPRDEEADSWADGELRSKPDQEEEEEHPPQSRGPMRPLGLPPLPGTPPGEKDEEKPEMAMTYANPFGGGLWPAPVAETSIVEGHFGRYELGAMLHAVRDEDGGSGSTLGQKYASMDTKLSRRVVVWHFTTPDGIKAMERTKLKQAVAAEVETLRQVRHPRLCPYLACELIHGELYVVLGYAPGGSVADWLQDAGQIGEVPAKRVAVAAAEGLQHLHRHHHTAHGSVRASNVLLGPGAAVRLADFGLGAVLRRRTVWGAGKGSGTEMGAEPKRQKACSSPWRAPELASQESEGPTSSEAADVWALGCLVVDMLAGYAACAEVGSLATDATRLVLLTEYLPPRACDVVRKCVRNVASQRPSVVQLLKDPWMASSD